MSRLLTLAFLLLSLVVGCQIPTPVRYDVGALSQWGDGTDNELLAVQQDLVILANGLVYNPDTGMMTNRTGNVLNEYQANLLPSMVMANVATGLVQSIAGESLGRAVGDGLFGTSDLNKLYVGDWSKAQQLMRMNGQVAGSAWGAVSGARIGLRGVGAASTTDDVAAGFARRGIECGPPKRVVIIGETMDRVENAAGYYGATMYGGMPKYRRGITSDRVAWEHNKRWLERKVRSGHEIISIDRDPHPREFGTSRFFTAEELLLRRLGVVPTYAPGVWR